MKKTTVKKSSTFFSPTSKVVHEVVKTHDPLVINKWMNSLKPNSRPLQVCCLEDS